MNKILGCLIATALGMGAISVATASEGTGVGNGGGGGYEEYVSRLRGEMNVNCPGGRCGQPDLSSWCSRVSRVLTRELQRAQLQLQYDRLEAARQILLNALSAASQSLAMNPDSNGPMTKTLIDRGLILNDALNQALPSGGRFYEVTKTNFVVKYVQMIIEIEGDLDRPWYIPYVYQYRHCDYNSCPPNFQFQEFERRFVDYAQKQLAFVRDEFTQTVPTYGGSGVVPVGSPKAFLVLTELMTSFVAEDLSKTLYAYANACVVMDLNSLNEVLRRYNWFGDRTVFPNDRWAVEQIQSELNRMTSEMDTCHRY